MIRTYPRAHLDLMLLAVLGRRPRDAETAMRELARQPGPRFAPSRQAVYTMLGELERNRLIARTPGRPRNYVLTDSGQRALRWKRREWETFAAGMRNLLDRS